MIMDLYDKVIKVGIVQINAKLVVLMIHCLTRNLKVLGLIPY